MFKVEFKDVYRFLSNKADYYDLYLMREGAVLIYNEEDLFLAKRLPGSGDEEPTVLRVPYSVLCVCDGIMTITVGSDVSLYGTSISVSFRRQKSFMAAYKERLDILSMDRGELSKFAVDKEAKELVRLSRGFNSIIVASEGVIYTDVGGVFLYAESGFSQSFSVYGKTLYRLVVGASIVFAYKNYIGCQVGDLFMLATKVRKSVDTDIIDLAKDRVDKKYNGSKWIAEVNFSELRKFAATVKGCGDTIEVDLAGGVCKAEKEGIWYVIPIHVEKLEGKVDVFSLPVFLVERIVLNMSTSSFTIKKKRNFIHLIANGINILVR